MTTVSGLVKAGAVAAVLAVGAYWYWSPFVAIHWMKAAAESHDADAFNEYVEYPRVRESLKGQMSAMLAEHMESVGQSGSDMARAGAAIGSALALALGDRLIDGMVRPESVMRVVNEARLAPKPTEPPARQAQGAPKKEGVRWTYVRKSVDKLVAYPSGEPENRRVSVVFERFSLFHWKMTEVRVPIGAK